MNRIIRASSAIDEPPPWNDDRYATFYIQGFGFVFEARMEEVLKAEYTINLLFQKTKYLTMENVLFIFGLPTEYIEVQAYYWDYRHDEDIFVSIDFQHEKMIVECNGTSIECIVISFNQLPEIR